MIKTSLWSKEKPYRRNVTRHCALVLVCSINHYGNDCAWVNCMSPVTLLTLGISMCNINNCCQCLPWPFQHSTLHVSCLLYTYFFDMVNKHTQQNKTCTDSVSQAHPLFLETGVNPDCVALKGLRRTNSVTVCILWLSSHGETV